MLFVCTGNIHRSALAHALFARWTQWYPSAQVSAEISVRSAGTHAPSDRTMSPRVLGLAKELGADGSAHRTSLLTAAQLEEADLVLTAATPHRDAVLQLSPGALRRTFTIREAGRAARALPDHRTPTTVDELNEVVKQLAERRALTYRPAEDDIVDPQGKPSSAYLDMAREEVPALADLATVLLGMTEADRLAYHEAVKQPAARRG